MLVIIHKFAGLANPFTSFVMFSEVLQKGYTFSGEHVGVWSEAHCVF